MNPDPDASVCARPTVCSSWATPYTTPSPRPTTHSWGRSRRTFRQKITSMRTAAIEKRTARKSVGGTVARRSWMRKKVEPHTAVRSTSRPVATAPARAADGATSDDRQCDRGALAGHGPPGRVRRPHDVEQPAEHVVVRDLETGCLEQP